MNEFEYNLNRCLGGSPCVLGEAKAQNLKVDATAILKQLMSSVADKVVKGSKCPVMVVKP
jgi:hypothetical protein